MTEPRLYHDVTTACTPATTPNTNDSLFGCHGKLTRVSGITAWYQTASERLTMMIRLWANHHLHAGPLERLSLPSATR